MNQMSTTYRLGVDIGSTTVKVAVLDQENRILFSDYERHYANIQETLAKLLKKAVSQTGDILVIPVITGSGGLTLSSHLHIPFVQEVVAVASSLQDYAPQTDVAIELGGEDAKIIIYRRNRSAHEWHLCGRHRLLHRPDGLPASDGRLRLK